MDIAEVAKLTGMPASTLRYYEEKGLIASTGRDGLRRRFGPRVLDRLAVIALGRAAGFSLDEIRAMFTREGGLAIDRAALVAKADELDRTIKRLQAVSSGLRHAAVCKAPSHLEVRVIPALYDCCGARCVDTRRKEARGRQAGGRGASGQAPVWINWTDSN